MEASEKRFAAQAQYAQSILSSSLGDNESSIAALERALEIDAGYAPAVLSMGSVKYQLGEVDRGKELLLSLVSSPASSVDGGESELVEIIDEAGSFLIHGGYYADGLELYRAAVKRFPKCAVLHQGLGCCAGHEGLHPEAVSALRTAVELEPQNQEFVNDLGWSLFETGRFAEARQVLERAVEMDPSDKLARENLRICVIGNPEAHQQ